MSPPATQIQNFHPLLLICLMALAGCAGDATTTVQTVQTVVIDGQRFELKLALTSEERYQGLSGVASIPDDGGMLFVFPDVAERVFVMRDCLVPIDIIFLGPGGRVVAMHQMAVEPAGVPLTRYASQWPAQFAIELQGGKLDELGLALGDRIDLPTETLKRQAR